MKFGYTTMRTDHPFGGRGLFFVDANDHLRAYAVRSVSCQLALNVGWVSAQIANLRYKNHLV